MLYVMPDII